MALISSNATLIAAAERLEKADVTLESVSAGVEAKNEAALFRRALLEKMERDTLAERRSEKPGKAVTAEDLRKAASLPIGVATASMNMDFKDRLLYSAGSELVEAALDAVGKLVLGDKDQQEAKEAKEKEERIAQTFNPYVSQPISDVNLSESRLPSLTSASVTMERDPRLEYADPLAPYYREDLNVSSQGTILSAPNEHYGAANLAQYQIKKPIEA